ELLLLRQGQLGDLPEPDVGRAGELLAVERRALAQVRKLRAERLVVEGEVVGPGPGLDLRLEHRARTRRPPPRPARARSRSPPPAPRRAAPTGSRGGARFAR